EMGHMLVTPYPGDNYTGKCPFHGNKCVEGMAAGPSLEGRTGIPGEKLPRDHKVFTYVSYYVAQLLFNAYMTMRSDVMVVGGSVLMIKTWFKFVDSLENLIIIMSQRQTLTN